MSTRWCLSPQNTVTTKLHDCTFSLWYIVSCDKIFSPQPGCFGNTFVCRIEDCNCDCTFLVHNHNIYSNYVLTIFLFLIKSVLHFLLISEYHQTVGSTSPLPIRAEQPQTAPQPSPHMGRVPCCCQPQQTNPPSDSRATVRKSQVKGSPSVCPLVCSGARAWVGRLALSSSLSVKD